MPLDKSTLQAQLALLVQNGIAIDTAITDKTKMLQDLTVDLERTRGARQYHDLVVQQFKNMLADVERAEAAAATPPGVA